MSLADLSSFSFHKNFVLAVENFWPLEERQFFREGMCQAAKVREDFQNAETGPNRRSARLSCDVHGATPPPRLSGGSSRG